MKEENNISGNQIVKGSFWIIALELSNQGLQLIKTFYAARILTPADFGIVGFAFLIISLIDVISTTGMKEAIIQRKDDTQSYLSTVYMIEIGKGLVVFLMAILVAVFFVDYIHLQNARLTQDVILFIGCIYFIQCSTNVGVVYFEKEMQFKKFFLYQFSGTIADVLTTLVLVYYLQSVAALFLGLLAGVLVRAVFSFILIEFKPKIEFHIEKAKELLRYGKWILKARIFTFLGLQLDSIVISSFFSLSSLGTYQMALRIGNLPMMQVSNVMGKLVFPAFSKVHDEQKKIKDYFLTTINVLLVALFPLVMLIFILIPEFVQLFLGSKWMDVVAIVRILILSGLVRILTSLVDYLFCALGEPKKSAELQFYRFVCFGVLIFPLAYRWGILGVAITGFSAVSIVFILYSYKACKRLGITFSETYTYFFQPLIYGTIITMIIAYVKLFTYSESDLSRFLIFVILIPLAYITPGWIFTRYTSIKLFEKSIMVVKSYRIKI